jgi:hypothetical protein
LQHAGKKILLVGHDARSGGAQLLALGLVRTWTEEAGCAVHTMLLGGGPLLDEFKRTSHALHVAPPGDPRTAASAARLLRQLRAEGIEAAVCNTIVAAQALPWLRDAGIATLCLIHELPAMIRALGLATAPALVAAMADGIVFPAEWSAPHSGRPPGSTPAGLDPAAGLLPSRWRRPSIARPPAGWCGAAAAAAGYAADLVCRHAETRKGFRSAAAAGQELGPDCAAVCVWIGVDGARRSLGGTRHATLRVGRRIRLLPRSAIGDPGAAPAAADVFLPRAKPVSHRRAEAMSFGIPWFASIPAAASGNWSRKAVESPFPISMSRRGGRSARWSPIGRHGNSRRPPRRRGATRRSPPMHERADLAAQAVQRAPNAHRPRRSPGSRRDRPGSRQRHACAEPGRAPSVR